jgi:3-phosphoshikimate 1-carboxyvinyltransferase
MRVRITPHRFSGVVKAPSSKSHTIRQLLIASLADGVSEIKYPLDSLDTRSCLSVCKAFGAEIIEYRSPSGNSLAGWKVHGNNSFKNPAPSYPSIVKSSSLDIGNSGTTLYLALAAAGLQSEQIEFTGDEQIQKRSAAPLLEALAGLGILCGSGNGCVPITVKGPWKGGKVSLPCPTSQYLSALLIASPLAPAGSVTEIDVPLLNEKPYVEMTLSYLKAHGIPYKAEFIPPDNRQDKWSGHFTISGGSSWKAFTSSVPGDFSSAAFPAAAAAISGGQITLLGLDPQDSQGDKFFFKILEAMGCEVRWNSDEKQAPSVDGLLTSRPFLTISRSGPLRGGTFDLNETPDLLPAAAAVAAFANGDTALVNAAHARIKETDRIAVMVKELAKLGISCTEKPDGLIIHGKESLSLNKSPVIDGHGDHRIVMAFAAAALGSSVPVEITTAKSAAVTYPGFLEILGAVPAGGPSAK